MVTTRISVLVFEKAAPESRTAAIALNCADLSEKNTCLGSYCMQRQNAQLVPRSYGRIGSIP